jgi:DNA-binding CsgD family transcriptional regulator
MNTTWASAARYEYFAAWADAVLNNGLARYDLARRAAQRACGYPIEAVWSAWALVELVEAAARTGMREIAADAHRRLAEMTRAIGSDWALGVEARSHALLARDTEAEDLYGEAIERLGCSGARTELARAHLLYGEWLRRERRRGHAREQLRTAHAMFSAIGVEAYAERARRELNATGETARRRTVETLRELTPQEASVAGLAREGLSNAEIGARLFISAHTVEYHLKKVFTKLAISSRGHLGRALPVAIGTECAVRTEYLKAGT